MYLYIGKPLAFSTLALLSAGAAAATLAALDSFAQEDENAGMRVASNPLFRKIPGGNALFSSVKLSPERRRAVLMLAREPASEAELSRSRAALENFEKTLPDGDRLFLIDDSGTVLLERGLPNTRKIFDRADEIGVIFERLESVPVGYFPPDALRAKTARAASRERAEDAPETETEESGGAR